ncbi:Pleckstrin y domain, variant 2 [Balamuthia mandrillaris]
MEHVLASVLREDGRAWLEVLQSHGCTSTSDLASLTASQWLAMGLPLRVFALLTSKGLTAGVTPALIKSLDGNKTITELLWANEVLSSTDCILLSKVLRHGMSRVTRLELNGGLIGDEGTIALSKLLLRDCWLRHLDLSQRPQLEQSEGLYSWETLRPIGEAGVLSLGESLRHNTTLQTLDLSGNPLRRTSDKGMDSLMGALHHNSTLRYLNLSRTNLTSKNGRSIATALIRNHGLHTLCLEDNDLREEGAQCLAAALASNVTLTSLNLRKNWSPEECDRPLAFLADCLHANNNSLLELQLTPAAPSSSYPSTTNHLLRRIQALLTQNRDIAMVKLVCSSTNQETHSPSSSSSSSSSSSTIISELSYSMLTTAFVLEMQRAPLLSLNLSNMQLRHIPGPFADPCLRELILCNNQLTTLPAEFKVMPRLERMDLSNNLFETIPNVVSNYTRLQTLDVSHNRLMMPSADTPSPSTSSCFPPMQKLSRCLRRLYLNHNHLTELPAELFELQSLKELDLSFNVLTTLAPEIGDSFSGLRSLSLIGNSLISVPSTLQRLTSLTSLFLAWNKLEYLPLELRMENIANFTLTGNPLSHIPSEVLRSGKKSIFRHLDHLREKTRCFSRAKIIIVGPALSGKSSLFNALLRCQTDPSSSFAPFSSSSSKRDKDQRRSNTFTFLSTNQLLVDEAAKSGIAIAAWRPPPPSFFSSSESESAISNSPSFSLNSSFNKLPPPSSSTAGELGPYFSGSGELSSFIAASSSSSSSPSPPSSHSSLPVSAAANTLSPSGSSSGGSSAIGSSSTSSSSSSADALNNQLVKFQVWDLCGNPMLQPTQQLFMNSRSIFLLCFDLTTSKEVDHLPKLEYWLRLLEMRSFASPIIVVGTHYDDKLKKSSGKKESNKEVGKIFERIHDTLGSRFSKIMGYVAVSSKTNKGMGQLVSTITEVAALCGLIHRQIPASYLLLSRHVKLLRRSLEKAEAPPFVSTTDFARVASRFGLSAEDIPPVIRFLHEDGGIAYFPEDGLKDSIYLDVPWLVRVLFSVFVGGKSELVRDSAKVIHSDITTMWKDHMDIPSSFHSTLLKLLHKFYILHPLTTSSLLMLDKNAGYSLVPAKLSPQLPPNFVSVWANSTPTASTHTISSASSTSSSFSSSSTIAEDQSSSAVAPSFLSSMPSSSVSSSAACSTNSFAREYRRQFVFNFMPDGLFLRLLVHLLGLKGEALPGLQALCYWRFGLVLQHQEDKALLCCSPATSSIELTIRVGKIPAHHHHPFSATITTADKEKTKEEENGSELSSSTGNSDPLKKIQNGSFLSTLLHAVTDFFHRWYTEQLQEVGVPCVHCNGLPGSLSGKPTTFFLKDVELALKQGNLYLYCNVHGPKAIRIDHLLAEYSCLDAAIEESKAIPVQAIQRLESRQRKASLGHANTSSNNDDSSGPKVITIDSYQAQLGGEVVVVKDFPSASNSEEALALAKHNLSLLRGLSHPHLAEQKGFVAEPFRVVTEYPLYGSLYIFLRDMTNTITWTFRLTIALQICEAIKFLHQSVPSILHGNLNSANVLMTGSNEKLSEVVAKVDNFGIGLLQRGGMLDLTLQDYNFQMAPELLADPTTPFSPSMDVFSFGMLLWEMLAREDPFLHLLQSNKHTPHEIRVMLIDGLRPTVPESGRGTDEPEGLHAEYSRLIEQCWQSNPTARPSFNDIAQRLLDLQRDYCGGGSSPRSREDGLNASISSSSHNPSPVPRKRAASRGTELRSSTLSSGSGSGSGFISPKTGSRLGGSKIKLPMSVTLRPSSKFTPPQGRRKNSFGSESDHNKQREDRAASLPPAALSALLFPQGSAATTSTPSSSTANASAPSNASSSDGGGAMESQWSPLSQVQLDVMHSGSVHCLVTVQDRVWAACGDGSIFVWNLKTKKLVKQLTGHTAAVHCLLVVNDQVWSGSKDSSIIVWDAKKPKLLKQLKAHAVYCLADVGDDVWSGSSDYTVIVWSKKTFKPRQQAKLPNACSSMVVWPDHYVWIGSYRAIMLVNPESLEVEKVLEGHAAIVHQLLRVNDVMWSCSSDKTICVWDRQV